MHKSGYKCIHIYGTMSDLTPDTSKLTLITFFYTNAHMEANNIDID